MMPPNQMPPQGGPPMPGAAPAPMAPQGPPPQQSQGPSDVDQVLLKRFQGLNEQEHDALDAITPEGAAVIMKLVPELAPVMQMMLDEQGGSEGEAQAEAPEPSYGPEGEDGGPPMIPQKPKTQLGRM